MKYAKTTLLKNEDLKLGTKPHPIIFANAICVFILALLFYANLYNVLGAPLSLLGTPLNQLLSLVTFCLALVLLVGSLIAYYTSEYVVTTKRVLMKTGLIQRYSLELFLERVEGIYVDQSILGRILKYGTITVVGTGGTKDFFPYVPGPLFFRNKVQQEIDGRLNKDN